MTNRMGLLIHLVSLVFLRFIQGAHGAKATKLLIKCAVCKTAMKEARSYAKNNTLDDEDELGDMVENLCKHKKKEGDWVAKIDIIKSEGQLVLQKMDKLGECKEECKAIHQACSEAVRGKEEKIVSMLKASEGLSKLQNDVCHKPCNPKKPLPSLDEFKDEKFEEDKDAAINTLMESMKGMPGMENLKMYKPGDLPGMGGEL